MPKGPRGQRRPTDVIGNAVKIMKIAAGGEPDDREGAPRSRRPPCSGNWAVPPGTDADRGIAGGDRQEGGGEAMGTKIGC
jgi:hypothetical protein